jgi:hypothetical protein
VGPLNELRRRGSGVASVASFAAVAALVVSMLIVAPVAAADPVRFGLASASSSFGDGVDFRQPVTLPAGVERVEILVSSPGAIGPTVQPVEVPPAGDTTLRYHLDAADGGLVPNTPFTGQWRVVAADGTETLGPAISHTYADDRFDWKTLEGQVVRVHWVEGNQAFAQRALKIGDDAVQAAAALLGVKESTPIDFFIYADQSAFYDALGPGTRENVGGEAHPDIRTLFALITPDEIDASWVESVVPHELTHVVFQDAVDNPYHDPAHWLNEGLAVYEADGYATSDRQQVEGAARDGTLMPLAGLAGAFPTSRDRFFLAYAESVSAVDRIVRAYGKDALVKLIRSYHDGVSDDEAFRAALGVDVAGFQRDWLAELHAVAPAQYGPRPAPAGPLPSGWTGPQPNPSFDVVGSEPPQPPGAPRPGSLDDDPLERVLVPMTGVIGLVLIVVIASLGARRAATRGRTDPDAGWNRLFGRSRIADDDGAMDVAGGTNGVTRTPGEAQDGEAPPPEPGEAPPTALAGIHFGPGWDEDQVGAAQDGAEEAGPVEPEEPPR